MVAEKNSSVCFCFLCRLASPLRTAPENERKRAMDRPAKILKEAVKQALQLTGEEEEDKHDLSRTLKEGLNALLVLRSAHRVYCDKTENLKEVTASAKSTLDETNLQLQNLGYERRHYSSEIFACEDFPSKYTQDQLELLPEEIFLQTAPSAFTASQDDHERMRQRILWEAHERKEALQRLEALKTRKNALEANLTSKRRQLDQYSSTLGSLKRAAQPLQQQLRMQPLAGITADPAAQLLPTALYILYSQASAAATAFGIGMTATITGSTQEAEAELSTTHGNASGLHTGQLMTEHDPNVRAAKRAKIMSAPHLLYKVPCSPEQPDHYPHHE